MNRKFLALWAFLLGLFVALELYALGRLATGDTFSELVWSVTGTYPILYWGLILLWAWLGYHFFVERKPDH